MNSSTLDSLCSLGKNLSRKAFLKISKVTGPSSKSLLSFQIVPCLSHVLELLGRKINLFSSTHRHSKKNFVDLVKYLKRLAILLACFFSRGATSMLACAVTAWAWVVMAWAACNRASFSSPSLIAREFTGTWSFAAACTWRRTWLPYGVSLAFAISSPTLFAVVLLVSIVYQHKKGIRC